MIELAVVLALVFAVVLACVVLLAVANVLGEVIGAVFGVLGWLIALPFTILGWIVSVVSFVVAGPLLLLLLLAPLGLIGVAFGLFLVVALMPAIVVGGVLWALALALTGGGSSRSERAA